MIDLEQYLKELVVNLPSDMSLGKKKQFAAEAEIILDRLAEEVMRTYDKVKKSQLEIECGGVKRSYETTILSEQMQPCWLPLKRKPTILFVEDGSVDLDELKAALQGTSIKVIVYRQGSKMPQLVNLQEEMIKKL